MLIALIVLGVPSIGRAGSLLVQALDKTSHEPLIGATVIAGSPSQQRVIAGVTDSNGVALLENLAPGSYSVTFFYADAIARYQNVVVYDHGVRKLIGLLPPVTRRLGCWYGSWPALIETSSELSQDFEEDLMTRAPPPIGASIGSRDPRDHFRIDGFRLAHGAAPLPNLLVREVTSMRAGYPARWGGAAGPLALIESRSGSNNLHGRAMVRGGLRSLEAGGSLAGPIAKDHAWFALGIAPWTSRESGQLLRGGASTARVQFALTSEHQGDTLGLLTRRVSRDEDVNTVGVGARWVSKFHDHRTQLELAAARFETTHELARRTWSDDLRQAEARLIRRQRARGQHELVAGVDAALLSREDPDLKRAFRSRQLALHANDAWSIRHNLGLDLGLRWERERTDNALGRTYRDAVLPRVGAWYDWTREGRSRLYGQWGRFRAPTSADSAEPIERTIAVTGVEYELMESLALGVAYEGRGLLGSGLSHGALLTLRRHGRDLARGVNLAATLRAGQFDLITMSRYTARVDGSWGFDLGSIKRLWIGGSFRRGLDQTSALSLGKRWRNWSRRGSTLDLRLELAELGDEPAARLALNLAY